MAATGGTGGLGALPLAGIGAAVVVVGGAVMAWLGVFDSDDMRRIVERATSEETTVVISPSAGSPAITQGLSLEPDPVANGLAGIPAGDQGEDQARDVGATPSLPQDATQDEKPTAQLAAPVAPPAETLPEARTSVAEASDVKEAGDASGASEGSAASEDSAAGVSATAEVERNPVPPSPDAVPVSPVETVETVVTDEQGTAAAVAAAPVAAEQAAGNPEAGDVAQVQTEVANAGTSSGETETQQAQDTVLQEPVVAETVLEETVQEEPVLEAPALEAPRLDLVRIDPTGQAVIAGRAAQGVQVSILLDGEVLEKVEVQSGGDFVSLTSIRPSATARVISLRAEADGQQRLSETSFILAPASAVPATASAETADQPATLLVEDQVIEEAAATEVAIAGATREEMSREEMTGVDNLVSSEVSTEAGVAVAGVAVAGDTADDPATAVTSLSPVADTAEGGAASRATASAVDGGQIASGAEEISDAPSDGAAVTSISPADVTTQAPQAAAPSDVVSDPDTNQRTAETTAQSQPDATSAGAPEAQADAELQPAPRPEATQVAVLRADADGVVLVQPVAQKPQGKVVLDTISYSDSGEVQLAGRARADARVLVYLDNASAGQFVAGSNGSWSGGLEAVVPGVYTLRLDEVNADGKVLSRLETPFKREAPEVLRPPVTEAAGQGAAPPLVRAVTVQKGDTLWAISQERYGSGFLYVRVFAANQDAIRNPDLIYPGQVFTIPE